VIRFLTHQYRYGCRAGFGRRQALTRALRVYMKGFR
jgi:hypothetical protein